ncbi:putative mercury transport protein MerC [Burkholderiales bacterium GJ-E10]|nr:putative mercury transport protein MerC [Burkholderiales bacterium GJ-E10]
MKSLTRIADKVGVFGSLVAAMSCAMCFPALAGIGAAVGLGFLSRWEPVFLRLLPILALIALLANALAWRSHRQWHRSLLGSIGPLVALIGWFAFVSGLLAKDTGRGVLYAGLVLMLAASIWDLVSPAHRRCTPDNCSLPSKRV